MSLITLMQSAYDILMYEMSTRATSSDQQDAVNQATIIANPATVVASPPNKPVQNKLKLRITKMGIVELANYEALANQAYLDSGGVKTVGIGLTVSDIKDLPSWPWTKSITDEEAVKLYLSALKKYDDAVNRAVKVDITPAQYDALVSITYNIGIAGMQGSTFMKRVNAGATPEQIAQAMSWWNQDNGRVVQGLVNRRKAEGQVYITGKYKNDNTVARIAVAPMTHKPVYRGKVNIMRYLS